MMVELVTVHRLFRYADFGFLDDRVFHRTIGRRNGHIVLFIEKDGMYSILREVARKHSATAIALNGFPSYLTSEFLIRDMARAGLLHQSVVGVFVRLWGRLLSHIFLRRMKWG